MYIGGFCVIVGTGLALRSFAIVGLGLGFMLIAHLFVRFYEEPVLERRFGSSYLEYKNRVQDEIDRLFPQDPWEQLWGAIDAVFNSWMIPRAVTYRRLHGISGDWGTAVNVQAMVFGNMGEDCATGVAFTRDPSTGEDSFYGEYLVNAQGEDVVAGIRTPQHLTIAGKEANGSTLPAMEEVMPEVFRQLADIRTRLETHYRDMQDVEFTVQKGKLYMLQTRGGKRTSAAALKIAVDMVSEGLIDEKTAVMRIDPASLDQLLHPTLDPAANRPRTGRSSRRAFPRRRARPPARSCSTPTMPSG